MATSKPSEATVLSEQQRRRMRRLLMLGSAFVGLICLLWATVFALRGSPAHALLEAPGIACAAITAWLAYRGHLRAASRLTIGLLYLTTTALTVLLDTPTPMVPRSSHNFLLALGVIAGHLMHDEHPTVRIGVPLLCYATFVVLAATPWGPPPLIDMPESLRITGLWINPTLAVLLLLTALHVLHTDVAERHGLEAELRDALLHGDMLLHFQPQMGRDGVLLGAEALVRWKNPRRGMISPAEFIPLAERCGLMVPLGDWVLRSACSQLATWKQGPTTAGLVLAVNVSPTQFSQPDFVERVLGRVREAGIDPSRLKIELTESMLAEDLMDIMAKMALLKSHGIGFSLDDFGTGFSSLSYLRRLPLDQLKIDQSFVRNMLSSPGDTAIAQTVIALGHSLGLAVIAEGVETLEQQQFLAAMGCDAFQGYLISRPIPAVELEALLAQQTELEAANDPRQEPHLDPRVLEIRPTC